MKRPFITLCIFLFIGIISAHFIKYSVPMYYLIFVVILTLVSLLFYERVYKLLLILTIITLGAYLYGQSMVGDILLEVAPSNTTIGVEILKEASSKRGYTEYEVEIKSLFIGAKNKSIKVNKKAQLNLYESEAEYFLPTVGDVVEISNIKVKKLLENYREDEINGYELFLKSKGMEYILDANTNDIVKSNINYKYVNISNMSYKAKIYLEDFLDSTLDFENSNILKSIIFGNQGYLSKDKLDMFSKTGTAHIMAVSGLHVGLMVLVVDRFLKLIKIGRNSRLYLTVVILILYGYMVYFPVSILRAGIMYLLYVIAYFLERRYDSINALFFIAFILLIYRPMTIFSISFQLSFIATLSILLLSPILNEKLNKRIGFLSLFTSKVSF